MEVIAIRLDEINVLDLQGKFNAESDALQIAWWARASAALPAVMFRFWIYILDTLATLWIWRSENFVLVAYMQRHSVHHITEDFLWQSISYTCLAVCAASHSCRSRHHMYSLRHQVLKSFVQYQVLPVADDPGFKKFACQYQVLVGDYNSSTCNCNAWCQYCKLSKLMWRRLG